MVSCHVPGPVSVYAAYRGVDGTGELYVDGVKESQFSTMSGGGDPVLWKKEFAATPLLVAVTATRYSRPSCCGGWILASLSNGFVSDVSWKCEAGRTISVTSDWIDVAFDDYYWGAAAVADNDVSSDYVDTSDVAVPIWWQSDNNAGTGDEATAYCRGTVGKSRS